MTYNFIELGKEKTGYAKIEAESINEAIEKFGGVDEVINPHERFKKMYFGGMYYIKEEGNINPLKVVHSTRVLEGYGYHGGGRPRKDTEARRTTVSISGTKTEIEKLRQLAKDNNKTVSRLVLDTLL